jgi:Icc-related predicted phosphoesterase
LRVAALYDVHGNLQALDAVLAEADADVILVGGDVAAGPWPPDGFSRRRRAPV